MSALRTRALRRALALALVGGCAAGGRAAGGALAPWGVAARLDHPAPFADGRVRTVNGIAFTPDGRRLYVSDWVEARDATGRRRLRIFEWRHEGGRWVGPHAVAFGSAYTDYQPVMHPDGSRLYFQSTRPAPGDTAETLQNLWVVERVGDGWSAPRELTALNSPAREGYAAPLADGTLYFNSDRPGGRGLQDFYRARLVDGRWTPPVPVDELNTADGENDLFVDPRGRFVIFNRYVDSTRAIDLYVAFRAPDGRWGVPRPLDAVNGPGWELTPTVTPDGRYFLFTRDARIHRVELVSLLYRDEPVPGRLRR